MSSPTRRQLAAVLGLGLTVSGVQLASSPSAQADVTDKITAAPYSQTWSDPALITTANSWSGVTGIQGYRGDGLTTATGADPQTITADGAGTPTNVIANSTGALGSNTSGGIIESEADGAVALQGSGTAAVPHLVFHLDLSGRPAQRFSFNAKDLDGSADNATQAVAVQYRVGGTGAYTNLPAGYVADATEQGSATKVTPVAVDLPSETIGNSDVYVRVLTTNAVGSDEWVGIDDISVANAPTGLAATSPGNQSGRVGTPVTPVTLTATGGTSPYTWSATGLPAGVTISSAGTISGTPTASGSFDVIATVTDSATPTAATDDVTFTYTVAEAPALRTIAEIQGTGTTTPLAGQALRSRGVVTAVYATGGLNGFNIQTPGPDTTPGASDGVFVYGGTSGFATYPSVGDSVEVSGTAAEYTSSANGVTTSLTQVTDASWTVLTPSLGTVSPLVAAWFTTEAERESHEGELVDPNDAAYTVTNSYATWQYGEVGLATGTTPLIQPTEVADFQTGDWQGVAAQNARRLVTLDDGKTQNFGGGASGTPSSWLDATHPVRAGAAATLKGAFIVDHRNGLWKLQPTAPVDGLGTTVAEFANTRVQNAAPANVGGDIRLATFNVLNYFPTTGAAYVASGAGTCTYYNDRAGNPIGVNTCTNNGPRGAADQANFERQQSKIVAAINGLTASVVSLEELENSVKFGKDRDDAIGKLVAALNAAAGAGTWAYVPSPAPADRPAPAEEDVIRTGFIYKPADVAPVGASMILKDEENFDNAREPLAQAFKRVGAPDPEAFGVVVNHLKSKGDSNPPATGDNANGTQGAFNGDRVRQVGAMLAFAKSFQAARGIQALFLAGDFNSYSQEDPAQAIEAGGFTQIESSTAGEETYFFNGLAGSLDHVYGNPAAMKLVTGADVWNINSPESVAYQYGRFNYNATQFFQADQFGASDHDPEIVGLRLTTTTTPPTTPPTKGDSTVKVKVKPGRIKAGKSRVTAIVKVRGDGGVVATGPVQLTITGKDTRTVSLKNGKATIKLGKLSAGKKKVYVYYGGSDLLGSSSDTVKITVRKK